MNKDDIIQLPFSDSSSSSTDRRPYVKTNMATKKEKTNAQTWLLEAHAFGVR